MVGVEQEEPRALRLGLVGPQGPFFNHIYTLLRHLFFSYPVAGFREFWLVSAAETQDFLLNEPTGAYMVCSHSPRPALYDWLARNGVLTIAVLDHPYRSVSYQMDAMNGDHFAATPIIARGLAALGEVHQLPLRVVLTAENGSIRLSEFLIRLSRVIFGHALEDVANLLERLQADLNDTVESAMLRGPMAQDLRQRLPEAALADVEIICGPLVAVFTGQPVQEFNWPISFFLDGKGCARPASQVVELVGPARCLYYGPYLHLPRGRYQGEITFGLSAEVRDTYLRITVVRGADTTDLVSRAKEGGIYTMAFELDVEDACQELEVRILIDRGEIEGRFVLGYVQIKPASGTIT